MPGPEQHSINNPEEFHKIPANTGVQVLGAPKIQSDHLAAAYSVMLITKGSSG
jgi:hypothetical protein